MNKKVVSLEPLETRSACHDCLQLTFYRTLCIMNYVCGRASSDKENINAFNKQLKTSVKKHCFVNRFTADCNCLNHYSKRDGQHKMKRLKSRRERSHMRGGGEITSSSKSHQRHFQRQTSKDIAHVHNCCHSISNCHSSRDALFPNVVPAAQEPSIITDSRLIGHQGLFNHEVKSVDIERLLSEQKKLEKSVQQVQEKSNSSSHPSSTSNIPFPFSINGLLGTDTDEVVPVGKKADPVTKAHDDFWEKEKTSQGSDLKRGQTTLPQPDLSSGDCESIFSAKHSSIDVMAINSVMSEKGRESQQTPFVEDNLKTLNKKIKRHIISSTLEHTPKNQESPLPQTQAPVLSPSPPQLSTADSSDLLYRSQDPDHTSQSISALAASLGDCLKFPLMKRRGLVAENREVLLKALQDSHGPQLQENLLKVQQCLSSGTDPAKEILDQEPTMIGEDELSLTDAFTTAHTDSQLRFDNQKTTSFKMTRGRHFDWQSSPHQHHSMKQAADWLTSPVNTSVSLLDEILRPTHSPHFCMDLGVTASDRLFVPSLSSWWGEKASVSRHWEDRCNKPKSKKDVIFGSFGNSFINQTSAVTEGSSASRYNDSNIQSFFPHQAQLPDRQLAGAMLYSQEQDSFGTDRYSFVPSFSAQIHNPQRRNHFKPFSQISHPSTCPPLSSNHINMMHFPPSHMLERDPARPLSSFPSPDHWSFPPMRLY